MGRDHFNDPCPPTPLIPRRGPIRLGPTLYGLESPEPRATQAREAHASYYTRS